MATPPTRRYAPLPLPRVAIDDSFWAPRTRINRERTIPHVHRQNLETGRLEAFRPNWNPSPAVRARRVWGGTTVMFWDSDVAKWLEAAAYSLATHPDPHLDTLLDDLANLVAGAQLPDGYLNTWFRTVDPANRWKNLRDWHELYCAGHLIEAAVAHYQATGKRTLLDALCRYADYIATQFGPEEGQRHGYCGHPEIELALVRLAEATGEQRYLDLSRYFVNERGRRPHYFDQEAHERGELLEAFHHRTYEYNQSHAPVREQTEVVGHAVRAVYLYSAMADLAMRDGDQSLYAACKRLWTHLTSTRMYVTGGIGTSRQNEGFTGDYDLPNESAYAETCAGIGLIFWARRMLEIELDRRYSDILELALYNAVLSGVSLDGVTFFYDNPLSSTGQHHRAPWFDCPCCPPNLARIIASLSDLIYAQGNDELAIHLYVGSTATCTLGGQTVTLHQQTRYPWDGAVAIRIAPEAATEGTLALRLPGWCNAPNVRVNGVDVDTTLAENGYLRVRRVWQAGDLVELDLPMPIEYLYAHPNVRADTGRAALRRGPLLYCLEQMDHVEALHRLVLPGSTPLAARFDATLLGGVVVIEGPALAIDPQPWDGTLYRTQPPELRPCTLHAIPYFAWDNRAPGAMTVWLPVR